MFTPDEVEIHAVLEAAGGWVAGKDVARCVNLPPRAARHHLKRIVDRGLADVRYTLCGYRYRCAARPCAERLKAIREAQAAVS